MTAVVAASAVTMDAVLLFLIALPFSLFPSADRGADGWQDKDDRILPIRYPQAR